MTKKLTCLLLSLSNFLTSIYAESVSTSLPSHHLAGTYAAYYPRVLAKNTLDAELSNDQEWMASLVLQVTVHQNGTVTGTASGKRGHTDLSNLGGLETGDYHEVSYSVTGRLTEPTTLDSGSATGGKQPAYDATLFFSDGRGTLHAKVAAVVCPFPEEYRPELGSGHLSIKGFYTGKALAQDECIVAGDDEHEGK